LLSASAFTAILGRVKPQGETLPARCCAIPPPPLRTRHFPADLRPRIVSSRVEIPRIKIGPRPQVRTEALNLTEPVHVTVRVDATTSVSALLILPTAARSCFVLAHGAGAGMTHPFMTTFAAALQARDIATLRYQFPFMEAGSKRPDRPTVAQAAVRAAVAAAADLAPGRLLIAGGKSFGGRMTSQTQAIAGLPGVRGLAFLGFPLHPAGKPSDERAAHLEEIGIPMLFVQGTRDALAEMRLLEPVVRRLGARATLVPMADADHAFHVPARTGRTDAQVLGTLADALAGWIAAL
jgi:predicted alpha/beta-hydrolase family hydrolase